MTGEAINMTNCFRGSVITEQWKFQPITQSTGGRCQRTVFPRVFVGFNNLGFRKTTFLVAAETVLFIKTLTLGIAPTRQHPIFTGGIVRRMTKTAGALCCI
jgi:hypothetical protein